jgi:hypothetical protein
MAKMTPKKFTREELMRLRRLDAEREEYLFQKRMKELRQPAAPFDWTKYNQDRAEKAEEQKLIDKLILEMLDIGYKVLAVKFHPDKPTGSKEAFQRLNAARKQAKARLS